MSDNIDRSADRAWTPAVSIITPSYRVTEYIGETLESAIHQTFQNFELIVVNDGCPDTANLEKVLAPYLEDSRIRYIKQDNMGVAGARNTAIRAARAPLLAQLDPDDVWEPDYLEVQMAFLEQNPGVTAVYPNMLLFGDTPNAGKTLMDLYDSRGEVTFSSLVSRQCHVSYSMMLRRDAVVAVDCFDPALRSAEDFDLCLRIVLNGGRIAYHRQPLVRYRCRPGNLTADQVGIVEYRIAVLRKAADHPALTPADHQALDQAIEQEASELDFIHGRNAFCKGDFPTARFHLARSNRRLHNRKVSVALLLMQYAPPLAKLAARYQARD